MPKIEKIKTLENIAVRIRELAIDNAPKKTGNLIDKIRRANTPAKEKMIKQLKDFSIELSLDYAPDGASYGVWFNDPPNVVSKRRKKLKKTAELRGNWNYAEKAMDDKVLNKEFESYLEEIGDYIIGEIETEIDN